MSVQEVKYEDVSAEHKKLSEEEVHRLKKKQEAFDKLLETEQKAKYKIEVMFRHSRKAVGPVDGSLSIWESGTKLNGEGDAKVYFCPSKEMKRGDCNGLLPDVSNGMGHLVCPKCGVVWKEDQVYGEIFFRLPYERWADVLVRYYALTGNNADVYVKFPKHDVRAIAKQEQAKQLMGERYAKLRSEKVLYIYPLKNIIKDTSNGADLYGRFKALLTA